MLLLLLATSAADSSGGFFFPSWAVALITGAITSLAGASLVATFRMGGLANELKTLVETVKSLQATSQQQSTAIAVLQRDYEHITGNRQPTGPYPAGGKT